MHIKISKGWHIAWRKYRIKTLRQHVCYIVKQTKYKSRKGSPSFVQLDKKLTHSSPFPKYRRHQTISGDISPTVFIMLHI